jgi:hypothetical protein
MLDASDYEWRWLIRARDIFSKFSLAAGSNPSLAVLHLTEWQVFRI